MIEQRRLEELADFDSISKRQKELEDELVKLAKAKKAKEDRKKRARDEEADVEAEGAVSIQYLQRKFLKLQDFLHVSRVLAFFLYCCIPVLVVSRISGLSNFSP